MKKMVLLGWICLGLAGLAQAQRRYELTVKEAVDLAFKNVIELKNAEIDYRIQEAQNREIFGQALPQVSGNVGAQYYLKLPQVLFPNAAEAGIYNVLIREGVLPSTTPIPQPTLQSIAFQQPWNFSAGATLQQLLFQPDVFVGLQARKTALALSTAVIEQTKERIRDSAYRRYYAVLVAEKQLEFIDTSIRRVERLYRDDSLAFRNGFRERLDIDRTLVQLNNLRTNRMLVESGIRISYAAMKFSLGLSQKDTLVLREQLTNETIREGILNEQFTYEDRAEIRTLQRSRELRQLDVKRNKLGYLPTVALAGNYSVVGQGPRFFTSSTTNWFRSAYVGMNISIPIFDGFQRRYRTQQARLNVEKLDSTISQAKQGIDLQQAVSRESLQNALSTLDLQQRNLELAQRVYNTTRLKRDNGLGSGAEVLLAELDVQQAQSNYYNALYSAVVARIAYLSALGKLQ
jgi:outer membrane protein